MASNKRAHFSAAFQKQLALDIESSGGIERLIGQDHTLAGAVFVLDIIKKEICIALCFNTKVTLGGMQDTLYSFHSASPAELELLVHGQLLLGNDGDIGTMVLVRGKLRKLWV